MYKIYKAKIREQWRKEHKEKRDFKVILCNWTREIVKKYSPDYIEEGKEYIKKSIQRSKIIRIDIEHVTGKSKR